MTLTMLSTPFTMLTASITVLTVETGEDVQTSISGSCGHTLIGIQGMVFDQGGLRSLHQSMNSGQHTRYRYGHPVRRTGMARYGSHRDRHASYDNNDRLQRQKNGEPLYHRTTPYLNSASDSTATI